MNRYKQPIVKMQAVVRGKLVHRTYHVVKDAAIFIQKAFRRHLRKKYYLIRLWRDYRKNIYTEEKLKARELSLLSLPKVEVEKVKYYPETVARTMQYYPRELQSRYGKTDESMPEWVIN